MDRNPTPPPEILNDASLFPDKVGETFYSKTWIYKTLMTIIKCCEKHSRPPNGCVKNSSDDKEENSMEQVEEMDNKNDIVELDPEIEEIACILWDMSADKDVAEFLFDSDFLSMFLDIIDKTKSPRLLEIVLGVLGNMSSFDVLCENISKNKNLLYAVIQLTGTSDTPTLLQVFRVILCGISTEKSQKQWISLFKDSSVFMDNIKFILENCLNVTALKEAFNLLHIILQEEASFCESWGKDENRRLLIEAGKQLIEKNELLDNFFSVFYVLWQYPPNQDLFMENFDELRPYFTFYFISLGDDDTLPEPSRVSVVCACFELYNAILRCEKSSKRHYLTGGRTLDVLSKFYRGIEYHNSHLKKSIQNKSMLPAWEDLATNVLDIVTALAVDMNRD